MENTENKDSVYSKLAKVALKECEERFRIFMETTKEGVVIHDRFKIIEANRAFAEMFGFKLADILGRDVLEFIAPQSRDLIMDKLLAGDESPCGAACCKKGGSTIAVEFCSRAIPYGGNKINLTLFSKLNHKVEATPENSVARANLGLFFEYAPDAYYLADATGTFIDVNKAARKLFGHKKEFIIGKSFLNLKILAPNQIHKAARHLALNIFGKPAEPEEYVIQREYGRRIPVKISTRPVKVNGKNLLFGIIRDITEKKKTEEALQRAVKEIEMLVEERGLKKKKAQPKPKKKAFAG